MQAPLTRTRAAIVAGRIGATVLAMWPMMGTPSRALAADSAAAIPRSLDGIARGIPDGEYRVRVWAPAGTPDHLVTYVLSRRDAAAPDIAAGAFVTDLGVLGHDALVAEIARNHANAATNGDLVIQPVTSRNGTAVAYVVRPRDVHVTPYFGRAQQATLYLSAPESVQAGGGGGGAGGM
jgi:hypothetical protein